LSDIRLKPDARKVTVEYGLSCWLDFAQKGGGVSGSVEADLNPRDSCKQTGNP